MADGLYDVVLERDVMVEMRDGVRLATDLYFPARDGQPVPGKLPCRSFTARPTIKATWSATGTTVDSSPSAGTWRCIRTAGGRSSPKGT